MSYAVILGRKRKELSRTERRRRKYTFKMDEAEEQFKYP